MRRVWVVSDDGVRLAVRVDEPERAAGDDTGAVPTLVCVHGYPDDSSLWDGVRTRLCGRFRLVTYDVRGAGESHAPRDVAAYRLDRLAADLAAVVDEVAPGERVHLLAHDWGSIQTWHAVTGPWLRGRVASFTSISGPSLDHAAHWFRSRLTRGPGALAAGVRQAVRSAYLVFFQLPLLPELAWRFGLATRLVRAEEPAEPAPRLSDALHGLNLYRANIGTRLRRPDRRPADIPVQVLAPRGDPFVGVPLQTEIARWVTDLWVRRIPGGHWVVRADPARVAEATAELVDAVHGGPRANAARTALRHARITPAARGRFAGRLVVVTGAANGIGRATASAFAHAGADVVLADRDAEALAEATRALRESAAVRTEAGAAAVDAGPVEAGRIAGYRVDVSDADAMTEFAAAVRAEHGVPDIVVNNAGVGTVGSVLDTDLAEWHRVVDINLWGVVHGSRVFGRQLRERGEGGHLVNIASMAAYLPNAVLPVYSTTKAAVLMFSESLRAELAEHGIGVSVVCPGFVATSIVGSTTFPGAGPGERRRRRARAQRFYDARNYPPERVADDVLRAVERDRPLVPSTPEAKIALALSRLTPGLLRVVARRRGW